MKPASSSSTYVEALSISLIQEYLYRKEFYTTLKTLFSEQSLPPGFSHRRAPLAKELKAENLIAQNKLKGSPFSSLLELIIKSYLFHLKKSKGRRVGVQVNLLKPRPKTFSKTVQTKPAFLKNEGQQTDKFTHSYEEIGAQVGSSLEIEEDENTQSQDSQEETSYSQNSFILTKSGGENSDSNSESEVLEKVASPPTSKSSDGGNKEKEANPPKAHKARRSTPQRSFSRSLSSSRSPTMDEPPSDPEDYLVAPLPQDSQFQSSRRLSQEDEPPQSFHSEFLIKKLPSTSVHEINISPAESLLQSKREILAKGSLSYSDFRRRSKQDLKSSPKNQKSLSFTETSSPSKREISLPRKFETLELCDIEDEDFSQFASSKEQFSLLRSSRNGQNSDLFNKRCKLDSSTASQLQQLVMGKGRRIQEGWLGQGFHFSKEVPYGLVQRKGGPCGVLAVVQSLLLRNLLFPSTQNSENSLSSITSKRTDEALSSSIFQILSKCADQNDQAKSSEFLVKLYLNSSSQEILEFASPKNLAEYLSLDTTLSQLDCLGLVYSAVLTRGLDHCQEDMDFPDSPLIGQHGYCSSELINLLLFGQCFSNQFDKEVSLDGKILRGIPRQSEIGFLSLFEHFGSCEVGSFLKNPRFPIWIVCSESHFSVLFSLSTEPLNGANSLKEFDLFYYDGLANQQQDIKLTISFGSSISQPEPDADLVSPLEKCIRTKWKNACISWNGTEPLL